jgi:hypothetical protein
MVPKRLANNPAVNARACRRLSQIVTAARWTAARKSRGLVIACSDGAELFEFTEEILDEVARPVEGRVELAGRCSVFLGRDHGGFSRACQWPTDTLVGVVGLVGDQDIAGHLRQQGIGTDEVMDLSLGKQEALRIAEPVDESVDLGAQSALAATDRLIIIFFWVRRRYAGGPARWCYRSSHIRCPHRWPSAETLAAICPSRPSG